LLISTNFIHMRRFILLISFISIYAITSAQFCEISGSVADSINREPLVYGNISVLNSSDSVISGCLSNEKGDFRIRYLDCNQQYHLLIQYTGYESKRIDLPTRLPSRYQTGTIFLKATAAQLSEAVVEGNIQYMEQKFDRKVYTMNETKVMAAKNIFDLLRTLPGVTVDEEGNVKYKGAAASIYVDDMPAQYIYPNIEMIPVALVIKIEVIDASLQSGSQKGGIINIKMKNMATDGLSGLAQAKGGTVNFRDVNHGSGFGNLNYKYKNILLFVNLNYYHEYSESQSESEGSQVFNETEYRIDNVNTSISNVDYFWNYGGIRYNPNMNTRMFLSLGLYRYGGSYPGESNHLTTSGPNANYFNRYTVISDYSYQYRNVWLNTYYYHRFDSLGKEISAYAGCQQQFNDHKSSSNYRYQYLSGNANTQTTVFDNTTNMINTGIWTGVYYNHPFSNKSRWNVGWRGWFSLKNNQEELSYIDAIPNLPTSGTTQALTQSHTVYSRYGTTLKKWKIDAGLSLNYNLNDIDYLRYNEQSVDTSFVFNKYYINPSPSATIIYSADSLNDFKISYSHSVQTPYYTQVCDFVNKQNPYSWNVGNPALEPVNYHNFFIGYTLNKNIWNVNIDVFYSLTRNDISYLTLPVTETIWISMPENIGKNTSTGIDVSAYASIKSKIDLNFSSRIYHTNIKADNLSENVDKKDFGYQLKLSTDIRFNRKTSATVYVNYVSREIRIDGYSFGYFDSSASFTRKFFGNNLMCTIGISNILNNLMKHGDYTEYAGIVWNTLNFGSKYKPMVFASLQYKFRQGDRGTQNAGKMN